MKATKEPHAYWEQRSATILDAYAKGHLSKDNPVHEAQIEWAQLSNKEKERGYKASGN